MNDALVRNWNKTVSEDDIVIFVGDFAFQKKGENNVKKWIDLLHGHKVFIRGNHDRNKFLNSKIFSLILHIAGKEIYCVHNPRNFLSSFEINLVGHVHDRWKVQKRGNTFLVNVGVDVWQGLPVDIEEILNAINEFKKGIEKDFSWK